MIIGFINTNIFPQYFKSVMGPQLDSQLQLGHMEVCQTLKYGCSISVYERIPYTEFSFIMLSYKACTCKMKPKDQT